MNNVFDIIIPTWNLPEFFNPCIESIVKTGVLQTGFGRVIVVNNGTQPIKEMLAHIPQIDVVSKGENLGWEGGLKFGLEHSTAPFVCFQNDDTFIPKSSQQIYHQLLVPFQDQSVAAVGPTTTVAAGLQSVFNSQSPHSLAVVPWLIFFTVMVRRSHLDKVGGIDATLPGGDDFDLSIRFQKAGKKLLINPNAFLIHHGFKTGTRVRGGADKKGGWNSQEMQDNTNRALIEKHGFKTYIETMRGANIKPEYHVSIDKEGDLIRSMVNGQERVLELGCGAQKTVERAIGVDRVPKGEAIPNLINAFSVADIVCDVTQDLPIEEESHDIIIARHILEHCVDSTNTIKNWKRVLKTGGQLILAVPDEQVTQGIPLNPEHVHAFTEESLSHFMEALGFKTVQTKKSGNGVSFVGRFEKC